MMLIVADVYPGTADRETAFALMGASVAAAGLVLVYGAFLIAKAADYKGSRRGDKFLILARWSLVPALMALLCTAMSLRILVPGHWGSNLCASWAVFEFEVTIALIAIYAVIAGFRGIS
jgi:hypothetical protein